MPKPRPLGNKAKEQVEIALDLIHGAVKLARKAPDKMDRDPDLARQMMYDVDRYGTQAENILLRLKAGDFADDD